MNSYKKNAKYLGLALGALSISMLAGCATSGTHATTETVNPKLSKFDSINVVVSTKVPEATSQLKTIQDQVLNKLEGRFTVASLAKGEHQKGVLGMKLEVVDFKAVGGAAHFFLGGLAGPDRVSVAGTFYDMGSGKKIGAFTSTGEARLGGIVTGNTGTVRASEQLGKEIAALIDSNR